MKKYCGYCGSKKASDYRMEHTSPGPHYGAPMHDLTDGIYPEDLYSPLGAREYGHNRGNYQDKKIVSLLTAARDKPNYKVMMYRAVLDNPDVTTINPGDWVTIDKSYAIEHSRRANKSSKILSKEVTAKELWTNGNSFYEWGYHP
jgi:hypothetical protein